MSYEGYEQHICKNGHLFSSPCSYGSYEPTCHECKAESIFCNSVDQTNGPDCGRIDDWSSLLLIPGETQVCNLGHKHTIRSDTYRAPTTEENKNLPRIYDKPY